MREKINIFDSLKNAKRQPIALGEEAVEFTNPFGVLPLIASPRNKDLNLVEWGKTNRDRIRQKLEDAGAILFRNFAVENVETFQDFIAQACGDPLQYNERSSPRREVGENVYTSTEHPSDQSIFLHNEQSYNLIFPLRIAFFCVEAATEKGATPIADIRKILARLSEDTRRKFSENRYLYVRNFSPNIGLSWQTAFQTESREKVESYCRNNEIEYEWKDENHLRTSQLRRLVFRHPHTQAEVWFNRLTFFHVSTLPQGIGDSLINELGEENLPNNTYYADGERIEPEIMAELQAAYEAEKQRFAWQKGDILLLDNMLAAHGREPFKGSRKIVVAMAEPIDSRVVR